MPTFDELTNPPDQTGVLNNELLPKLAALGARITDWAIGGVFRTLATAVSFIAADDRKSIRTATLSQFESYAFGFSQFIDKNGQQVDVTGWAPLRALDRYRVPQIPASYTKRLITLTNTSNASYGPLKSGAIKLQFLATKNRYVLDVQPGGDGTLTIPPKVGSDPGVVQAVFRSENLTDTTNGIDYSGDSTGATISFVTASYPGVTATNPAPASGYSAVVPAGVGLGTVTPSGTPDGPHFVVVFVEQTGNVGDATVQWSTSLDGANKINRSGTSASLGHGITVTIADNGGSPNFFEGESYSFQSPGTDVVQVGADVETPQQLGLRCWGLWPLLSSVKDPFGNWIPVAPTISGYKALTLSANSQVRVVLPFTDGKVNNLVRLIVAGQGGAPLPTAAIVNLQSFFDHFGGETDLVLVQPSTALTVTPAGVSIHCTKALIPAAQVSLTKRMKAYVGGVDAVAPLGINGQDGQGFVDYDYLIALIRLTTGVVRVSGTLTINGAAADLELPVTPGEFESPQLPNGFDAATAFDWIPA